MYRSAFSEVQNLAFFQVGRAFAFGKLFSFSGTAKCIFSGIMITFTFQDIQLFSVWTPLNIFRSTFSKHSRVARNNLFTLGKVSLLGTTVFTVKM